MSQLSLDRAWLTDRRRLLGGVAASLGSASLAASGGRVLAQASTCAVTPTETRGPFPADGTNGRTRINVLAQEGVLRRDLRPSFGGMQGRAEGVALDLELAVLRGGACRPFPGAAVYLWQNDAAGIYSLYNRTDVNYLRGLQPADAAGRVRFTLIVPGCYGGRYPHCHFEVFDSVAAATSGAPPLLISQLAFPDAECRQIYRSDARYGQSLANLERQPITRDFVFAANAAGQWVEMQGSPPQGYRGSVTVTVA